MNDNCGGEYTKDISCVEPAKLMMFAVIFTCKGLLTWCGLIKFFILLRQAKPLVSFSLSLALNEQLPFPSTHTEGLNSLSCINNSCSYEKTPKRSTKKCYTTIFFALKTILVKTKRNVPIILGADVNI